MSQINTDRWISSYDDYYLVFCLAAMASPAVQEDYVESTRLTAAMHGDVIGMDERMWKRPNAMWQVVEREAIFEWAQAIDLAPTRDGLIRVSIDVKVNSQSDWLPVDGAAYTRICNKGDLPQIDWKWAPAWLYPFVRLVPRRFRRSRTEW